MICYRDMTFCTGPCDNKECFRHKDNTRANNTGLPVAWSDFTNNCDYYIKPKEM